MNPTGSDLNSYMRISASEFIDVHNDAFAYLMSPKINWAVVDDCGLFPCTAPNNIFFEFDGIQYGGTIRPENTVNDFQLLPNNINFMPSTANCIKYDLWNGYFCTNEYLSTLAFDTLDADKSDRSYTPVTL